MIDRLMGALLSAPNGSGGLAWTIAWQSTLWLAVGLVAAGIWRRSAGRAHLLLVLATCAAFTSPLLTATVRQMGWGVLPSQPSSLAATLKSAPEVVVVMPQRPVQELPASDPVDFSIDPSLQSSPEAVESDPPAPEFKVPVATPEPAKIESEPTSPSPPWTTHVVDSLPATIAGCWILASLVLTIRLVVSLLAAWRIAREAHPETSPLLLAALGEAVEALSLPSAPHLRVSAFARSPMIWCWGSRPVVLLPESAAERAPVFWRSVFCHELAHLVRRDHWTSLWAEWLIIILPWQPLTWWAGRRLAFLREQACDDWVLSAGGEATDYAESLLQLAPQGSSAHALAAVSSRESLERRLQHMLSGVRIAPNVGRLWRVVASSICVAAIAGVALAQQQPEAAPSGAIAPRPIGSPSVKEKQAAAAPLRATLGRSLTLAGHVLNEIGGPVTGASVSAIATSNANETGGALKDRHEILGEATTDAAGAFRIEISGVSTKSHRYPLLMTSSEGYGLESQSFSLEGGNSNALFRLAKEQLIRGRFVDLQGQSAANVIAHVAQIGLAPMVFLPPDSGYLGRNTKHAAAWPKDVTSDAQGRFVIRGVSPSQAVYLGVDGDNRYAQQFLPLNGRRHEGVQTVTSLKPGEEAVVPLSPATVVEGSIRFADTKQPVPHARFTIYASQEKPPYGSFVGLSGQADVQGRFRIVPYPGIYFQVTAYPPQGTPYLIRQNASEVQLGAARAEINVDLPRGVLVRGKILEAAGGVPIANASIQYIPAAKTSVRAGRNIITGWPGIALSDSNGNFATAVLPGLGHLLIHGPTSDYSNQEIGDRELGDGRPGGRRNYAHAISRIDLPLDATSPLDLSVKLTHVTAVNGRLLTPDGRPVDEALMISRLQINPISPMWRGHAAEIVRDGHFALAGCSPGVEYPVYFLDQEHQTGATARVENNGREPMTVRVAPCGSAKARFVDSEGKPIADLEPGLHLVVTPGAFPFDFSSAARGQLAADEDFAANIDRKNQTPMPKTGPDGVATFRVLIPGATYDVAGGRYGKLAVLKQFSAEAGKTLDLGDVVADRPRER